MKLKLLWIQLKFKQLSQLKQPLLLPQSLQLQLLPNQPLQLPLNLLLLLHQLLQNQLPQLLKLLQLSQLKRLLLKFNLEMFNNQHRPTQQLKYKKAPHY
jgi:hypothetical protein